MPVGWQILAALELEAESRGFCSVPGWGSSIPPVSHPPPWPADWCWTQSSHGKGDGMRAGKPHSPGAFQVWSSREGEKVLSGYGDTAG